MRFDLAKRNNQKLTADHKQRACLCRHGRQALRRVCRYARGVLTKKEGSTLTCGPLSVASERRREHFLPKQVVRFFLERTSKKRPKGTRTQLFFSTFFARVFHWFIHLREKSLQVKSRNHSLVGRSSRSFIPSFRIVNLQTLASRHPSNEFCAIRKPHPHLPNHFRLGQKAVHRAAPDYSSRRSVP